MTNKTQQVIEPIVVRLTKLAHPQDLGEPTSKLEKEIRDELEKLVVTAREERDRDWAKQFGKHFDKPTQDIIKNAFHQGVYMAREQYRRSLDNILNKNNS